MEELIKAVVFHFKHSGTSVLKYFLKPFQNSLEVLTFTSLNEKHKNSFFYKPHFMPVTTVRRIRNKICLNLH